MLQTPHLAIIVNHISKYVRDVDNFKLGVINDVTQKKKVDSRKEASISLFEIVTDF